MSTDAGSILRLAGSPRPAEPNIIRHQGKETSQSDDMGTRRTGEMPAYDDERLARIETLLAERGGLGAWGRTALGLSVVVIGWIFSVLYIAKSVETEIRVSNAVQAEQLRETREQFSEFRRESNRDMKLADERYRQLSIALESRGIKLPTQ